MQYAPSLLALPVLIAMALAAIPTASGLCFTTNSTGIPLLTHLNERGEVDCLDGFVCAYLDPLNASTYPVYCPPSEKCAQSRAMGNLCESQGLYEPQIVPAGFYSPDRRRLIECPEGYFCPIGSKTPTKCPAMSICGKGASRKYQYGLLIFLGIGLTVLIVIVLIYRRFFAFSTLVQLSDDLPDGGFALSSVSSTPLSRESTMSTPSDFGTPEGRSRRVQLLCDGFKRRRGGTKPLRFEFHNLRVTVPQPDGTTKPLLDGVSGRFAPGKVTAILGPAESGKTTLLNALLGKLPPKCKIAGEMRVNGDRHVGRYRHSVGFVPEDDVLHTELSLYKNLYYSSEVRLPQDWSPAERRLFRSAVIDILGVAEARDVPIGDGFERGISGGQRKRASIGLELVSAPLAIFADSLTSGLDSFAAMELVLLLREIALQTHLCVAIVVVQPRIEIWRTLDEVLLLAPGGSTVYQGPQSEAREYFERCGVEFSPEANDADLIMDAITAHPQRLADCWKAELMARGGPVSSAASGRPASSIASPFACNDEVTPPPKPFCPDDDNDHGGESNASAASPTAQFVEEVEADTDVSWNGAGRLRQILLCHNRAVEKELSRMTSFLVEIGVALLCGLVLGQSLREFDHLTLYRDPYKSISLQPLDALLPQMSMYSVMSVGLGAATAGVRVLGENMRQYRRETAAGHSRLAYFLGSIWASMYRIVLCTYCFCALYFFIPGFGFDFGGYFLVYLSCYWCMYALAAPVSVVSSAANAPLIAALGAIIAGITSGFVDYPVWIKKLSFGYYTAQAMHVMFDKIVATAMDTSHVPWDYEIMSPGATFAINMSWGAIVLVIGFVLLIATNRDKQH